MHSQERIRESSSWWSLGLEDDIICASYLCVREWLCRPILDLQSRAQSGHWKLSFVTGYRLPSGGILWRTVLDGDALPLAQMTQIVKVCASAVCPEQ